MVGIFSAEAPQQLQGSSVSPKQAPTMPSNMLLGMLAGAVGVGSDIFKHQQSLDQADAAAKAKQASHDELGTIISSMQIEMSNVKQARLSGQIDERTATLKTDEIRSRYLNDHRIYGVEIGKSFDAAMGQGNLSKAIDYKTAQEKEFDRQASVAFNAGYIPVNATPEQQIQGINDYIDSKNVESSMKAQAAELKLVKARIANERGRTGLEIDRLKLQKSQLENQSNNNLAKFANYNYKVMNNKAEAIIEKARSSNDPQAIANARKELALLKNQTEAIINQIAPDASTSRFGQYTKPLLGVIDLWIEQLDAPSKATKDMLDSAITQSQFMLLSNMSPEEKSALAASKWVNFPGSVQSQSDIAIMNSMRRTAGLYKDGRLTDAISSNRDTQMDNKALLEDMTARTFNALSSNRPDAKDFVNTNRKAMSDLMKSVVDQQGNIKSYADIQPFIEWLGSPDGNRWTNEVGFTPDVKEPLGRMLTVHYANQVKPLLYNAWNKEAPSAAERADMATWVGISTGNADPGSVLYNMSGAAKTNVRPMKDVYEYKLVGDSVLITPKAGTSKEEAMWYQADAEKMNKAVNQFIMVQHNVMGVPVSDIYKNEVLPMIFGEKPEAGNAP